MDYADVIDDPRAPWNQPDGWEGRECRECRHCRDCVLAGGLEVSVCALADPMEQVDPRQPAQDCFEAV